MVYFVVEQGGIVIGGLGITRPDEVLEYIKNNELYKDGKETLKNFVQTHDSICTQWGGCVDKKYSKYLIQDILYIKAQNWILQYNYKYLINFGTSSSTIPICFKNFPWKILTKNYNEGNYTLWSLCLHIPYAFPESFSSIKSIFAVEAPTTENVLVLPSSPQSKADLLDMCVNFR